MDLKIRGLSYWYGKFQALENVSLMLKRGVSYGLVGPNGAGKTTLLRIMAGFLTSKQGEVEPKNVNLSLTDSLLPFFDDYPFEQFLKRVYLPSCDREFNSEIESKMYNGAAQLEIDAFLKKPLSKYSKGMRSKALILMHYLLNRPIWILDEPFDGLDIDSSYKVRNMLNEYRGAENLLLVSSHRIDDLLEVSDELIFILNGKIRDKISCNEMTSKEVEEHYFSLKKGSD